MADEPTDTTPTTETTEAPTTETDNAPVADSPADAGDDGTVLATAEAGTGDGEADGGTDGEGDKGDPAPVVPEAYDLKLTVAGEDGKESEVAIDTALLETATPVLKELGLTNEQANKVAALVPKVQERFIQQQNDAFAETRTQWAKDAQADPEIGGKNWDGSKSLAAKALDHFVGPAKDKDGNLNGFRQLLDDTGLGNHPEMIRFCRKVGAALSEDSTMARGTEGPRDKPTRLQALYPNDVPK